MQKFMLLSVIFASIAIPVRAAKAKNPAAGLKKALVQSMIFNAIYLFALYFIWGRL